MSTATDNLTEFRPDTAIPPGEHIKELLEEVGWTQRELARRMNRPYQVINEIINGKRSITAETAIQLEDVFGVSAETWMNLESAYRLVLARRSKTALDVHETVIALFAKEFTAVPLDERWDAFDRFQQALRPFGNIRDLILETSDWLGSRSEDVDEIVSRTGATRNDLDLFDLVAEGFKTWVR